MQLWGYDVQFRDWIALGGLVVNSVAIPIGIKVVSYVKSLVTQADLEAFRAHVDTKFVTKEHFDKVIYDRSPDGGGSNAKAGYQRPQVVRRQTRT